MVVQGCRQVVVKQCLSWHSSKSAGDVKRHVTGKKLPAGTNRMRDAFLH